MTTKPFGRFVIFFLNFINLHNFPKEDVPLFQNSETSEFLIIEELNLGSSPNEVFYHVQMGSAGRCRTQRKIHLKKAF